MLAHTSIGVKVDDQSKNEYHMTIRDKENEKNFMSSKQTLMILLNKRLKRKTILIFRDSKRNVWTNNYCIML